MAGTVGAQNPLPEFQVVDVDIRRGNPATSKIDVSNPNTGEIVGEIVWDEIEYEITIDNVGDGDAENVRFDLIAKDAITNVYGGKEPFARGNLANRPDGSRITIPSGERLVIIRNIITRAYDSEYADAVNSPLSADAVRELNSVADQVQLAVYSTTGTDLFDLTGADLSKLEAGAD